MDQDDAEKRIADLEDQLAKRQRGADRPPARPGDAAASGRFVASGVTLTIKQFNKFVKRWLVPLIASFICR